MTLAELKKELKCRIDETQDEKLLEEMMAVYESAAYSAWLTERALKAEEDIKAGRVYTPEEVRTYLKERLRDR